MAAKGLLAFSKREAARYRFADTAITRLTYKEMQQMPELKDGESVEIQGSACKPYVLKNVGGVYSCACPAWRNQSLAIERRTCKHLRIMVSSP